MVEVTKTLECRVGWLEGSASVFTNYAISRQVNCSSQSLTHDRAAASRNLQRNALATRTAKRVATLDVHI